MRSIAAASLALLAGLCLAAPAGAQTAERRLEAVYAVRANVGEVGDFNYAFAQTGAAYTVTASRRITGALRMLARNNQDYDYSVRGTVASDGTLRPTTYHHRGGRRREDRPNGRGVTATFSANDIVTVSDPVGMGMGDPPATQAQRRGAIDQLTAIARMITATETPCAGTLPVYMDGRSRFDFVLTPNGRVNVDTRAYRGEAIRCSVAFRPIAGFGDPQEAATLTFLFAPTGSGMFAPIRIQMPTDDAGVITLEARSLRVNGTALR